MTNSLRFQRVFSTCCLASALMLAGCGGNEVIEQTPVVAESQPLATATATEVGLDAKLLEQAIAELPPAIDHGMHSMLVLRHGKLVLEQYWNGYDKDALQDIRSATKSITSLLTGVAIDKSLLLGVDEPIRDTLVSAYPNAPALAHAISIKHLLTMSNGLDCFDGDLSSPGHEDRMYLSRDWVAFFLALPLKDPPGSIGRYCTGGVVALGRIVAERGRRAIPTLADEWLFKPLGIDYVRWARFDDDRQTDTGGHLKVRPRDMAKLGQLVLQRGQWQGRQLVSAAWIEESTSLQARIDGNLPYGYLWWMIGTTHRGKPIRVIYANGNGGQQIYVIPELDVVAVFTGGNYGDGVKSNQSLRLLAKYIIPAVQD
ncbi:MAG: class C beta-lactamase-related serine hydrolase [Betaproteobacteria bacterium]|nr:MAG: class C beta-lactamase-related serine hydrolase [Betaproteobacteria bacterium]